MKFLKYGLKFFYYAHKKKPATLGFDIFFEHGIKNLRLQIQLVKPENFLFGCTLFSGVVACRV